MAHSLSTWYRIKQVRSIIPHKKAKMFFQMLCVFSMLEFESNVAWIKQCLEFIKTHNFLWTFCSKCVSKREISFLKCKFLFWSWLFWWSILFVNVSFLSFGMIQTVLCWWFVDVCKACFWFLSLPHLLKTYHEKFLFTKFWLSIGLFAGTKQVLMHLLDGSFEKAVCLLKSYI